ncbi:Uncharacterized protein FKW44_005646 [Caligus rogercresseyi]|uniref:Uncharacterized protein n=1 Tax=Caligus rogercresseyi TaxID=217165 RepID=A0A7T8KC97_CALRO|nr:Uncharacterized protein FKW44_005646 [Caligus rogercresseyi]
MLETCQEWRPYSVSIWPKNIAVSTQESTHAIATNVFMGAPTAIAGNLPSFNQLKRTIRNSRKALTQAPPNPSSLMELIKPYEYQTTISEDEFLLYDSDDGEERILLFSTHRI